MSQEEELPSIENENSTTACIQLISDILKLCYQRAERTAVALDRLTEITRNYDFPNDTDTNLQSGNSNKCRAQRDIDEYLARSRKTEQPIKPTSVIYREIAVSLARRYEYQFDPKQTKKKKDIIKWFDGHWAAIKNDFFVLLEKHPDAHKSITS